MKYRNRRIETEWGKFDSQAEYGRWLDLLWEQKAGAIQNLRRQVEYELIPSQKVNGKTVEKAVKYVADFVYEKNGTEVVEDVKGFKTKDYIIKRKLMLFRHGIQIKEINYGKRY